jgi:hypothetical protein
MYLLWRLYVREQKKRVAGERDPKNDFVNMMILFNSMRDMLDQQRELARQLNSSFDERIAQMRASVVEQLAKFELLQTAEENLRKRLDELENSLSELDTPILNAEYAAARARAHADEPAVESKADGEIAIDSNTASAQPLGTRPVPESLEHFTAPKQRDEEPLCAVAEPELATPPGDAPVWAGWDVGREDQTIRGIDVPIEAPVEPGDAEAARNAFRALLNFGADAPAPEASNADDVVAQKKNGSGAAPPLHSRVYEYNDAGMSVAQIAQELGIGKGEVRLILSLRKAGTE